LVQPAFAPLAVQVLVIVAASHLDAVTFQICSQSFKILPTAVFAVMLLGQHLTKMQWGSLPVLAVGVVLVTINGNPGAGPSTPSQPNNNLVLGAAPACLPVCLPVCPPWCRA
jgi:drug/metabolite transporter (DMT)-like permease